MKYVLAVSGGIDSVVLLDRAAHDAEFRSVNYPGAAFPDDFMVAHFDHGIRGDESAADAAFVRDLAKSYSVRFVSKQGHLAKTTSEEQARTARYEFLSQACRDNDAMLVTAHHQDDLVETVVINLIRGTGWRGLAPMAGVVAGQKILRPLLGWTKFQITSYALEHNLSWREDATNASLLYFRNRVRLVLQSAEPKRLSQLIELYERQVRLRPQIEATLNNLVAKFAESDDTFVLPRYYLIMLPDHVAIELLKYLMRSGLLIEQLWQVLLFIKTGAAHKALNFRNWRVELSTRTARIIRR